MNPTRIDLTEKLTPKEVAESLGVPFAQLQGLLEKGLFRPLVTAQDGSPRVSATALYPFLGLREPHRLASLERLAELAQRLSEPRKPADSSPNAALIRKIEAQALAGCRALVAAGELVDADTLAELLGTSTQAVQAAERDGRIFSLAVEGQRYFPCFYGDAGFDWHALEVVFRLLIPGERWAAFSFLRRRTLSLGGATPLDALRDGKLEAVSDSAMAQMQL
jgi:hypothetical protein